LRLIDADGLIQNHFSDEHRIALSNADKWWMRKIINDEPTVDAMLISHGKWIEEELPNADNNIYCTCSVCGAGDLHAVGMEVPHCWKCGAKMDLK
jgi:hypothetical protein